MTFENCFAKFIGFDSIFERRKFNERRLTDGLRVRVPVSPVGAMKYLFLFLYLFDRHIAISGTSLTFSYNYYLSPSVAHPQILTISLW